MFREGQESELLDWPACNRWPVLLQATRSARVEKRGVFAARSTELITTLRRGRMTPSGWRRKEEDRRNVGGNIADWLTREEHREGNKRAAILTITRSIMRFCL